MLAADLHLSTRTAGNYVNFPSHIFSVMVEDQTKIFLRLDYLIKLGNIFGLENFEA